MTADVFARAVPLPPHTRLVVASGLRAIAAASESGRDEAGAALFVAGALLVQTVLIAGGATFRFTLPRAVERQGAE